MIKSIKISDFKGSLTKLHPYYQIYHFQYHIIDDDFEEIDIATSPSTAIDMEASAIIECYSRRNLDVAKNLVKFMIGFDCPIKDQIYLYSQLGEKFTKHLPEINKYLNLL